MDTRNEWFLLSKEHALDVPLAFPVRSFLKEREARGLELH